MYNLPDLQPALSEYLSRMTIGHIDAIGGRRVARDNSPLPFSELEIWTKVHIQSKSYHYPHDVLPPQTVNAAPLSHEWPLGHYDSVIVNVDPVKEWPFSGLEGGYS
jgi:hypothetical protein